MADLVFTTIQIGRLIRPVSTMAEASKLYRSSIGNRGMSNMPTGWLINAAGERVGHVSYNGRVWTGTPQDWTRDKQPLYCPSQVAIWSKFGLYRMASRAELSSIVDASLEEITADLETKGFCLTFCDVEPVAILRDYPADKEPDEVLAWVNQAPDANGESV